MTPKTLTINIQVYIRDRRIHKKGFLGQIELILMCSIMRLTERGNFMRQLFHMRLFSIVLMSLCCPQISLKVFYLISHIYFYLNYFLGYGNYNSYLSYSSPYRSPYNSFGSFGSHGGYGGIGGYNSYSSFSGYPGPIADDHERRFIQFAEEKSRSTFASVENVVRAFNSLAMMVDNTFFAMTSSFRAVLSVAENFGKLRTMFGHIWYSVNIFR